VTEARVLLVEIASLKDRGLTIEVTVIDFVCPIYLYTRVRDPSRVTDMQILKEDVLRRVELMLRCAIINDGAPQSYSTWNLPAFISFDHLTFHCQLPSYSMIYANITAFLLQSPFSDFVSNPPIHGECSGSGHRAWLSADEIEAIVAAGFA
jgi:hypothetical protein